MTNIWHGKDIRLRAVKESDLKNYYLKTNDEDSDSIRNSDRMIFPVGDQARVERVAELSRQNPYNEEYTLIIENKEGRSTYL